MPRYLLLLALVPPLVSAADGLPDERRAALTQLLHQDCGSCHGMHLTGGLGPPLTTTALADKPRELLFVTIKEGRNGTPMPPWQALLDDRDINWLVDYLLTGDKQP